MRKWRLALIVTTFTMILLLSTSLIIHFVANANTVAAADILTITVRKNEAVSVYVTGIGITYDEDRSTASNDVYLYESGTKYTLTAVNEKKIFYSWEITNSTKTINPKDMKYTATSTENLIVDTVRVDPTAADYGKYMGNRFIISDPSHLVALQQIIAYAYDFTKDTEAFKGINESIKIVDCYNYFCSEIKGKVNATDTNEVVFGELTDAQKVTFIKTNELYERIRTGYFLVETSFSMFDMDFTGIGSYNIEEAELKNTKGFTTTIKNRYFDGVMCGKNGTENSQIVLVINDEKHQYKRYYGLFGYLGSNAVIRNLKVRASIGVSEPTTAITGNGIYAGAVAGYALDALVKDVDVAAEIGINVLATYEICAGAIVGKADGFNLDDICNIGDLGHVCKITVNTTGVNDVDATGNGYVGYVAGYGINTYIKGIEIDNTNMTLDVRNYDAQQGNIGVGGLIGHYQNDEAARFENVHFNGTSSFRIEATLQKGISSAGGLIGHLVSDSDAELIIGDVSIKNSDSASSYIAANTFDGTSTTNCYAGGLFGRIDGMTVIANDAFKNRIVQRVVDDVTITEYRPVFAGNIIIEAIQNGKTVETNLDDIPNYGDTVSGGLVGAGYMDINGTEAKITELILSTEGKLTVLSTQTVLATHEDVSNNQASSRSNVYLRHCISGGVFGIINDTYAGTIENINVYAENIDFSTNREIGSKTVGNLYLGGFTAYANRTEFNNVHLKYNNGNITMNSLSYEITSYKDDSNNAHIGGIIGKLNNNSVTKKAITNCSLEGFDIDNPKEVIGTNVKITSIQNSKAPGDQNYVAENYVGGLIGQMYLVNADNLVYRGSEGSTDIIRMAGHENPDSSFCGGLIGFIKSHSTKAPDGQTSITNCSIYNANVLGEGTNTLTNSTTPDMYIGGIIGAAYKVSDNADLSIENIAVENSVVEGIGNERIEVKVGGIMGGVSWKGNQNNVTSIENSYVYNSSISATAYQIKGEDITKAHAGGVMGSSRGVYVDFINNAIIDTEISADCNATTAGREIAAGIISYIGSSDRLTFTGNYSNAILESSASYGIANTDSARSQENRNYFHRGNAGGNAGGIAVTFDTVSVISNNDNIFDTSLFSITNNTINNTVLNNFINVGRIEYDLVYENGYVLDASAENRVDTNFANDTTYYSDVVAVWVNVLGNNSTTFDHEDSENGRRNGWFLMGYVNIHNNKTLTIADKNNMDDLTVHFANKAEEFEKQTVDGNDIFYNILYPHNTMQNIGYDYSVDQTITSGNITAITHEITARVYDEIPYIKINFTTNNLIYVEEFSSETTIFDISSKQVGSYGHYTIKYDGVNSAYELRFYPNVNIETDVSLTLKFKIGATDQYDIQTFNINLVSNDFVLVGATYAEYTPPVNYYEDGNSKYGSADLEWLLPRNTIIKIIPVFTKSNDINNLKDKKYIDEKYIEKVRYTVTSDSGTILSSGELTTPNSNVTDKYVTLTMKDGSGSRNVYFSTGIKYTVTHSIVGADVDMIPYATPSCDYEFIVNIHAGYAGIAKDIDITIGSTTYALVNDGKINATLTTDATKYIKFQRYNETTGQWEDKNPDDETTYYRILIANDLINGNIVMDAEFEHIYEITFDLQCGMFYPGCPEMIKTFKVRQSTGFANFFKGNDEANYKIIKDWVEKNTLYGYHFGDFYLVDNANTLQSYGEDFEELLKYSSYKVTTSLRFYARWNFLIELVEAPGTTIKTSFAPSFMEGLDGSDAPIAEGRVISVPINHTKGFVFTILKDENFIGEADVKAYVAMKSAEKVIINEITMEKYYEDMYLYFVPPEEITGYLIIVSSISNFGFIPGDNIATVTEEIIPEDGIYTFKYIANHKNTADSKSYIYNSGDTENPTSNLSLNKEFVVRFFKQDYVITDNVGEIQIVPRELPLDTIVEVYYQKFVNGELTSEIVGTTTIKQTGVTEVSVYDLTTIDFASKAFAVETFNSALGSAATVSEKYYVSITPPNGYSTDAIKHERFNYIIEGGYAERNNDGTFKDYVKGNRSNIDFANTPLDKLDNKEDIYPILNESSLQNAIYTVTPSRETNLTRSGDTYTFTDIETYEVFTIDTVKATSYGSRLCLTNDSDATNTIVTSRELPFYMTKMILRMGYGVGDVKVTLSEDNIFTEDDFVRIITVNSLQYTDYEIIVDNPTKYKYFQIDNVSLNEIRLEKLAVASLTNAMEYDMTDFTLAADKSVTLKKALENDIRHDGKNFILAVQIKKNGVIVDSIPSDAITLTANGNAVSQIVTNDYGRVTAYYNLTKLLVNGNTSVDFTINLASGYTISSVMLLEAENALKPAMAEVRYLINS